jgi:hypothetical protein
MAERRSILSERVDDIPLLLAQLERMGVRSLLDEYFPAHGHWVGLSPGWVAELWLTHILVGSRLSAALGRTWGRAATPHSARVHRAASPSPEHWRRPAGRGLGGLE